LISGFKVFDPLLLVLDAISPRLPALTFGGRGENSECRNGRNALHVVTGERFGYRGKITNPSGIQV